MAGTRQSNSLTVEDASLGCLSVHCKSSQACKTTLPNFLALVANVTLEQAWKHSSRREGLVPMNGAIYMEFSHSKSSEVMQICS